MRIAVDTNLVLRNAHRADPLNPLLASFLEELVSQDKELCISWQVLQEFWVVATRPPAVNGLGLTPADVRKMVEETMKGYTVLSDPTDIGPRWLNLCSRYSVHGRAAHDARIVAWMIGHEIRHLVTLNSADFKRYAEIECITPD